MCMDIKMHMEWRMAGKKTKKMISLTCHILHWKTQETGGQIDVYKLLVFWLVSHWSGDKRKIMLRAERQTVSLCYQVNHLITSHSCCLGWMKRALASEGQRQRHTDIHGHGTDKRLKSCCCSRMLNIHICLRRLSSSDQRVDERLPRWTAKRSLLRHHLVWFLWLFPLKAAKCLDYAQRRAAQIIQVTNRTGLSIVSLRLTQDNGLKVLQWGANRQLFVTSWWIVFSQLINHE